MQVDDSEAKESSRILPEMFLAQAKSLLIGR